VLQYILSLDQGTTSSRAIVYDADMKQRGHAARAITQIYPQPGWVEHDPAEIYATQLKAANEAILISGVEPREIAAIGIANQRETVVVWDRRTGRPIHNAIVWQCRRTSEMCKSLESYAAMIRAKTGLLIDAYFSGTKIRWLLDNINGAREAAIRGDLLAGTIDTWLIWNLTGGVHVTDTTNASRTMLFNIHTLRWDSELLEFLDIPAHMLPEVRGSGEVYGTCDIGGVKIPIASAIGDQQAALFGQGCYSAGQAKNTYGTGCFLLQNTGDKPVESAKGLLTTIAWTIGNKTSYALEGSIFIGGALIQWLRDELGLITTADECDQLAETVGDNGGAYIVPAFVGLGSPYWDTDARGIITGLTRGVTRAHICRAALEAIAYQVRDVLDCMAQESGISATILRVDGGVAVSKPLLQFQADICGIPVACPNDIETTAMGAAKLAGITVGVCGMDMNSGNAETFEPRGFDRAQIDCWHKAVEKAKGWIDSN
jgi:glycerol kinase